MGELKYNRILLKMSGEMLSGEQGFGIEPAVIRRFAREIKVFVMQVLK